MLVVVGDGGEDGAVADEVVVVFGVGGGLAFGLDGEGGVGGEEGGGVFLEVGVGGVEGGAGPGDVAGGEDAAGLGLGEEGVVPEGEEEGEEDGDEDAGFEHGLAGVAEAGADSRKMEKGFHAD